MYIYVQIFEYPFSVCWSIYLGVKLTESKGNSVFNLMTS